MSSGYVDTFDRPIETMSSADVFYFLDSSVVSCDPSLPPRDHSQVSRDSAISVGTVHKLDFGYR